MHHLWQGKFHPACPGLQAVSVTAPQTSMYGSELLKVPPEAWAGVPTAVAPPGWCPLLGHLFARC
ncbi:hypothetical protein DSO57_1030163 [Entomophthora muscae]|uniref:Uncharacterized protein n=1 Tax=Entomophthora muscae TaxID=34485 RepID=A0ACC2SDX9_9FUNG|nr:hypothetical protein DSO57_1030163 [Entomophthora muscae]